MAHSHINQKASANNAYVSNKIIMAFFRETLRPFRFWMLGQFTVRLVWAVDLSLRPYLLKIIINKIPEITQETVVQELATPIVFYMGMSFLVTTMFRFYDYIWLMFNPLLKRHLGSVLMNKMMMHSLTLFQNHFAGNLANKIKDVMSGMPDLVKILIEKFLSHILAFLIATLAVWTINYQFSILLVTWIIVFVTGSFYFSLHAKVLCEKSAEVRSTVMGYIVDILSNIMSVHLFAAKQTESQKLKTHLDRYVKADQQRDWWFLYMFAFQGFSFVIYQGIGFVLLVKGFQNGSITAGDFALLLAVNTGLISSLWSLSTDILKVAEILGGITQGLQVALTPIEIQDKKDAQELRVTKGHIVFDNVKFHYKGAEALFQNKSVHIPSGQKVGLVGYSGSGKSTFVNLILRLYDVAGGHIQIDGQDIRDVSQDSLHQAIGMIPQDPLLFHRTLMENIRYGCFKASDEEVMEAAKKAHAHNFIMKLPHGYNSLVGERGVKLSGGQRQRIAIARAILKNAPILILDEATSQLDSVTEKQIQESLLSLMKGKTTIVIAHRLSTLLHMDRILVFQGGKIIEDGTHQSLLKKKGLYKTMWDAQVGGFLGDTKLE